MLDPHSLPTFAACAATLAALCGCAAADAAERPLAVASYNIRSFRGMDGERDIDRTIAALKKIPFDICGLQEVRKTDEDETAPIEQAAAKLGMKAYFAQTLARPGFIYGIGLLSKYPFEVVEQLTLPIPPEHEPRTAIIAKIDRPEGVFYFINTHLSANRDDAGRREQLAMILETVRAKNYTPAILVGDLNSKPESKTIELLNEEWEVFGDETFTYPARKPRARIDYIAGYPKGAFRALRYRVVRDAASSDHRPLVAELQRATPAAPAGAASSAGSK